MTAAMPIPAPTSDTPSAYTIHEISTRGEINELTEVVWKAWWDPYLPNTRIAAPMPGNMNGDRERGIASNKDRLWNDFEKSKDKIWLCVKYNGVEIVGGVVINYAEGSAFPNGCPQLNLYWWPEGEEVKAFCEEMMNQVYTPRSMWMQRPHGGMWNLVVHPKHRGKGVAKMMMDYNSKWLDEKGLEGFVEATELGRPAYEKGGYQVVLKFSSFLPNGKSDLWKKWYHEMGVSPWYAMWRPKYGKIEAGERNKPWQQGPSIPI